MTPSNASPSNTESGRQANFSSGPPQCTVSLIQAWERREDIQSTQPHVDVTDTWSSDGASVSSSSCGSDQPSLGQEDGNHEMEARSNDLQRVNLPWDEKFPTGASYLKRARIFTDEETINQAIDRWQAYIRLCTRALGRLRQQLVDSYIPFALEQHRAEGGGKNTLVKSSIHADGTRQLPEANRPCGRRQKALRSMLRHSVKVANQRHQSCVSKFALVSNRLAKWRKPASTQRCRYRDPTTTTWENNCTNQCLPLLPVCAHHLVQLNPAPETSTCDAVEVPSPPHVGESTRVPCSVAKTEGTCSRQPEASSSSHAREGFASGDPSKKIQKIGDTTSQRSGGKKVPSNRAGRTTASEVPTSALSLNTSVANLQLPTQYLLRQCAGDESGCPCTEPVIAWSTDARCVQHTSAASICGPGSLVWNATDVSSSPAFGTSDQITSGSHDSGCPSDVHLSILHALRSSSSVKVEPDQA